jgi:transposase
MGTTFNYPQGSFHYNKLPIRVSRKEFHQYIKSHLSQPIKGPRPKLSTYQIFNYILYVLHTGVQWRELRPRRNEIHWSNIYKWHNRWSKDGSYQNLFLSSVIELNDQGQLDLSILHGDGSNTVAKKGVRVSDIRDTNIRRVRKPWQYQTIGAIS